MSCFIVIFELNDQAVLPALNAALTAYPAHCPMTSHSWAILSEETPVIIRDKLTSFIGPTDKLFVIRSGTAGAWRGAYSEQHNEWLRTNL